MKLVFKMQYLTLVYCSRGLSLVEESMLRIHSNKGDLQVFKTGGNSSSKH